VTGYRGFWNVLPFFVGLNIGVLVSDRPAHMALSVCVSFVAIIVSGWVKDDLEPYAPLVRFFERIWK